MPGPVIAWYTVPDISLTVRQTFEAAFRVAEIEYPSPPTPGERVASATKVVARRWWQYGCASKQKFVQEFVFGRADDVGEGMLRERFYAEVSAELGLDGGL